MKELLATIFVIVVFFYLATAKCFVTATTQRRDGMCALHTFTSFHVAHLAQPNGIVAPSRRRGYKKQAAELLLDCLM